MQTMVADEMGYSDIEGKRALYLYDFQLYSRIHALRRRGAWYQAHVSCEGWSQAWRTIPLAKSTGV